jgi:hypothetical protein
MSSVPWVFGEDPLAQTTEIASLLRRISGLALSLEVEDDAVNEIVASLIDAEASLAALVPSDPRPRVGDESCGPGRVYLDHSRHIGFYNPCFPQYEIRVDGNHASGEVDFPLVYEGPPGIVHGGFLAVFFDAIIQHHNCDLGVAGKTTSLTLRYRRPTPLLTHLKFGIERSVDGARITSTAQLTLQGVLVCEAEMIAVAGDRARLPTVGSRRDEP